jgi:inhibitor of KinA
MFSLSPLGDTALVIQFGRSISPHVHQRVIKMTSLLEKANLPGIKEWVPAYSTVTLFYDPYRLSYDKLTAYLLKLKDQLHQVPAPDSWVIHIPVCYGGKYGPDLRKVARHTGLTPEEVVDLHSRPFYLIYMLGFTPGFPYLGGLPPQLATPRRPTPRPRVAAGSVGIAGQQTGIYPLETPGGWQIIGRTPLKLYDPVKPEFLLKAGHYVHFISISEQEYERISNDVQQGIFKPQMTPHRRTDDGTLH